MKLGPFRLPQPEIGLVGRVVARDLSSPVDISLYTLVWPTASRSMTSGIFSRTVSITTPRESGPASSAPTGASGLWRERGPYDRAAGRPGREPYSGCVSEILNTPLGIRWDRMRGWHDQYERMHRWHARLDRELSVEASEGDWSVWPHDLWDTAMAFFQSAYHLKDWLLVDHPNLRAELENAITANRHLALCADICNGTKHREVTRNHRVAAHVAGMRESAPDIPSRARWLMLGPDGPVNLNIEAAEVLRAWGETLHRLPGLRVGIPDGDADS